jgi:hypothetical protein
VLDNINISPWLQRVIAVALAAGLYILSVHFGTVAGELKVLAGMVVGWLALPRPGDSRIAGVHPDDVGGSRS